MGNSDSAFDNEEHMLSDYQLVSTEDDKRFGEIAIYRSKATGELAWIKEVVLEDEISTSHYKKYLRKNDYRQEMFITQSTYFIGSKSHMCGACSNSKKLVVIMQYFERDLEGEIMRRAEDMVSSSQSI